MVYVAPSSPSPVATSWLPELVLRPNREAMERLNRAWEGVDYTSLIPAPLSLCKKITSLFIGALLALAPPFVNTVIWVFWQTFGQPERLSGYPVQMTTASPPPLPKKKKKPSSPMRSPSPPPLPSTAKVPEPEKVKSPPIPTKKEEL